MKTIQLVLLAAFGTIGAAAQGAEYVGVAANAFGRVTHPFDFVWYFGTHDASGNDARFEAERLCNTYQRGRCTSLGTSAGPGECMALVRADWIADGTQYAELFAASGFSAGAAQGRAEHYCEGSARASTTNESDPVWRCTGLGYYCGAR